jgi:pyruvate dehydrogenase E2 component (dihydrolipoamide acetyltransferase)
MATKILVPILGESIQNATLYRWNKTVGDTVKRGEEIAELETGKANMALESPVNGVMLEVLVHEGALVETGDLLAWIGDAGEVRVEQEELSPNAETDIEAVKANTFPIEAPASSTTSFTSSGERIRISPVARRLAQSLGIPLNMLSPSGTGLRIMIRDVERASAERKSSIKEQSVSAPARGIPGYLKPLTAIRQLTGERMSASVQQIPQYSISMEIDVSQVVRVKDNLNRNNLNANGKVSITAMLIFVTARAIMKNPLVNARYIDNQLFVYEHVDMAVAVATSQGLQAPVIPAVELLSIHEIAIRLNQLAEKARSNRIAPQDLEGGSFTLSNLGALGVTHFNPIINPPQAAILGVGAIRPVMLPLDDGGNRIAKLMTLTVTADHRVLDGADVAIFLSKMRDELQALKVE